MGLCVNRRNQYYQDKMKIFEDYFPNILSSFCSVAGTYTIQISRMTRLADFHPFTAETVFQDN